MYFFYIRIDVPKCSFQILRHLCLKKKRDATPDSPDSTPGIESLDPDILFGVLMSRQISESIPKAAHLSGAIFRGKLGSKTFDDL